MNKTLSLLLGTAAGALVGVAVSYLFGATSETAFDAQYQSRWDRALAEGRAAAATHEIEMRRQLALAKQPQTPADTGNP